MSQFSISDMRSRFQRRRVVYLMGELDTKRDRYLDTSCAADWQGSHRLERAKGFKNYMDRYFPDNNHRLKIVPGIGHSSSGIFKSSIGRSEVFD